jgi:hypothetical protein
MAERGLLLRGPAEKVVKAPPLSARRTPGVGRIGRDWPGEFNRDMQRPQALAGSRPWSGQAFGCYEASWRLERHGA